MALDDLKIIYRLNYDPSHRPYSRRCGILPPSAGWGKIEDWLFRQDAYTLHKPRAVFPLIPSQWITWTIYGSVEIRLFGADLLQNGRGCRFDLSIHIGREWRQTTVGANGQVKRVCKHQVSQASRRRGHRDERVQESCKLCHRGALTGL